MTRLVRNYRKPTFRTVYDFVLKGADACIRCTGCGHELHISGHKLFQTFGEPLPLEYAKERLRCSGCGKKGGVKIAAVPRLDSP